MRTHYENQTTYSQESIQAMTKMTYDLFHPEVSGRIYLISISMMFAGGMGSSYSDNAFFMVLLALGRMFYSDFGLFYQVPMHSGLLADVTDTIDVFTYKALTQLNDVGRAAAAGFLQSVLGFLTVLTANYVVSKVDPDNSLF